MTNVDAVEPKYECWTHLANDLTRGDFRGWIFRGLPRYGFSPISSIERVLKESHADPSEWRTRENLALAFFKERARHHLHEAPPDDDLLGWWALMQHYGAPTRLVDWTVSPLVACYFAYEQAGQDVDSAALWMLNARACRSALGTSFPFGRDHTGTVPQSTYKDGVEVERRYPGRDTTLDDVVREENRLTRELVEKEAAWPLPLAVLRPDRRMAAQQACFVCSGKLGGAGSAVEVLMRECPLDQIAARHGGVDVAGRWLSPENTILWPKPNGEVGMVVKSLFEIPAFVVKKIELPYAWRTEALASLARMNITADSLFPGLDGVGRTTCLYIQTGAPSSMREYLGL